MFIYKLTDEFGNIFSADIQKTSSGIKWQAEGNNTLHNIPLIPFKKRVNSATNETL